MKAFNKMASLLCVFLVIFILLSGVAAAYSAAYSDGSIPVTESTGTPTLESHPYISGTETGWNAFSVSGSAVTPDKFGRIRT